MNKKNERIFLVHHAAPKMCSAIVFNNLFNRLLDSSFANSLCQRANSHAASHHTAHAHCVHHTAIEPSIEHHRLSALRSAKLRRTSSTISARAVERIVGHCAMAAARPRAEGSRAAGAARASERCHTRSGHCREPCLYKTHLQAV